MSDRNSSGAEIGRELARVFNVALDPIQQQHAERIAELEKERDEARRMADAVAEGRIKDNKQAYIWRDERDAALALLKDAVKVLESLKRMAVPYQLSSDTPISRAALSAELGGTIQAFLARPEVQAMGGGKPPAQQEPCKLCRHVHVGRCTESAPNAQFTCACPGVCEHGKHPAYCAMCRKAIVEAENARLKEALEKTAYTLRRALTWTGEHEFKQHEEIHQALRVIDAALRRQS